LRKKTTLEKDLINKIKRDVQLLRDNKMDENRVKELLNQMKDKEKSEKEAEIEHKKWLEEREVKIAQMKAMRGSPQTRQKATIPALPLTQSLPSAITSESAKSPLNEPLKVDIDSETPTTTPSAVTPTNENKLTLPLSTPSTSPLLTSLLQSPTLPTPTILSPNKSGLSSSTFARQIPSSPISSSVPSITRRPSIHSSPEKVVLNSPEKNESVINPNAVSPVTSSGNINENAQQISSPTLSKLLEMPPSADRKIPPLPLIEAQVLQQKQQQEQKQKQESDQTQVVESKESQEPSVNKDIRVGSPVKSPTKISYQKQDSESTAETRKEEPTERLPQSTDQNNESSVDKTSKTSNVDLRDKIQETEKTSDNRTTESVVTLDIKREMVEPIPPDEREGQMPQNITIKEEPMDTTTNTTPDVAKPSPSVSAATRAKRKKTPTLTIPITPTATRRSGRVKALRDSKTTADESTEVSDQSAANTPQAPKKRGSVDETTETSMSEESMDAKMAITAPLNESLPNSPASSTLQTEDNENTREYKTWKKAIMIVWKGASTHKNASLFLQPVTESEAEGYTDIVHRPMDLTSIKKRIENGTIRTTIEFQRDIMLMFQNAIMFNNANHDVHRMAVEMQKETLASIEDFIETQQQNNQSSESKLRARERRSAAIVSPLIEVRKLKIKKLKFAKITH